MSKIKEVTTDDIKLDDVPQNLAKAKDAGIVGEVQIPVEHDLTAAVNKAAFYEELLTVHLSEPRDESDFPFCEIGVNGVKMVFRRGDDHKMPRKFVEVLARSKVARVETKRKTLDDGSETMVPVIKYSSVYPFAVTHDPSGARGAEWLKQIMAQPA